MKNRQATIITGILILAFTSLACRFSIPGKNVDPGVVATSVAATWLALTPGASATELSAPTAAPHALPTESEATVAAPPAPVKVSFVSSTRNLYVWVDGSAAPVQLTMSGDVDRSFISSDGSRIAFIRSVNYADYQLDVINSDGSGQRTLISSAGFAALPRPVDSVASVPYQVVWQPNSNVLSLNVRIEYMGPGLQVAGEFYNIDTDSETISTLMTLPDNWQFSYSPDGTKLAISHPNAVDLYNSNGTLIQANVVTHDSVNTASEYQWVASPNWQLDSSQLAMAIPPRDPFVDSPAVSLVWRVTNTGAATNILSTVMSFSPGKVATFNNGLTRIAYATRLEPATDNLWALHTANIDGSGDSVLANGYFSQLPIWAPDDAHYIYANMSGSSSQAYLGAEGRSPVLLPEITSMMDVRWIDSARYIISSREVGGYSLMLGMVGGSSGVIFNETGAGSDQWLSFDVNR